MSDIIKQNLNCVGADPPANPDVTATLHAAIEKFNALEELI